MFNDLDYFTLFPLNKILIGGAYLDLGIILNIFFEWGQTTPIWTLKINCPASCYLRSSEILEIEDTLYFAWAVRNTKKFLFSRHYSANATAIGNKYLSSVVDMERVTDMTLNNGIIYITVFRLSGNALLFIYNPTTDTWNQTYVLPTTYTTFFTLMNSNM